MDEVKRELVARVLHAADCGIYTRPDPEAWDSDWFGAGRRQRYLLMADAVIALLATTQAAQEPRTLLAELAEMGSSGALTVSPSAPLPADLAAAVKRLNTDTEFLVPELRYEMQADLAPLTDALARHHNHEKCVAEMTTAYEQSTDQLLDRAEQAETALIAAQLSERTLSQAYLRLRMILDAWDTPYAPTPEQVWLHTEARARYVVQRTNEVESTKCPTHS